jgi:nicotinate-nucleotide adenylyltransferase
MFTVDAVTGTAMIGILGGSFDPIHFGHLRAAVELRDMLGLREVRLVPCGQPPHRSGPVATARQRVEMLRLAIGDEPGFAIDEQELHRSGPSFTLYTVLATREEVKNDPICLIVGADQFVAFDTWHRWRELCDLAHIVVVYRPGWNLNGQLANRELAELVQERLTDRPGELSLARGGKLFFAQLSSMDIASSRIRGLIREGKSARYLVPDAVLDYIQQQRLYR